MINLSNQTILDRRWETTPTYEFHRNSPNLKFFNARNISKDNFHVLLSTRISTEAHIFLCEGFLQERNNCIWFLVMGFGGTKTEIGKCAHKNRSVRGNTTVHKSCKIPIKTIMHNNSESWNLTNEEWRHFELSKKDNRLSFRRLNSNDAIIQYDDSEEAYKITAMVLYTTGFWKTHRAAYLYTNQNTKQKTTVVVQPKNGVVCLSLFVKMCFNCKLTLTLSEENDENNILKEETYSSQVSQQRV
jgi:hypothetical protein